VTTADDGTRSGSGARRDEESAAVSGEGAREAAAEGAAAQEVTPAGPLSPRLPFSGPSSAATGPSSAATGPSSAASDSSFGEDELRALFHGAVGGLTPGEGVLDRLQAAVPARRARKRQTLVGVAAAVLLLGTAIPAAVHVAAAPGREADPAMAGSSQDAHASASAGSGSPESAGSALDGPRPAAPQASGSAGHRGGASGSPAPDAPAAVGTALADAPRCAAAQLGDAAADRGTPAADGTVYGSFRVANVSGERCAVTSPGQVQVAVVGGTSRTTVPVVEHKDGDAAAGLPGASQPALLLEPGQAYEIRFAFVPDSPCPSGGPSKGTDTPASSAPPSDTPSSQPPAETGGTGAGTAPEASVPDRTTTQFSRLAPAEDTPATTTVEVTHNAAPGGPVTNTTIPESCSGTVYRTGLLPADAG
jgi:hypothetical protein